MFVLQRHTEMNIKDYYCPNYDAPLWEQNGFKPSPREWTCAKCSQHLYSDEYDSSKVTWYCDGCGEELNKQEGFSENGASWICLRCGHSNRISDDYVYDSVQDYENHLYYDNRDGKMKLIPKSPTYVMASKPAGDALPEDLLEAYYANPTEQMLAHTFAAASNMTSWVGYDLGDPELEDKQEEIKAQYDAWCQVESQLIQIIKDLIHRDDAERFEKWETNHKGLVWLFMPFMYKNGFIDGRGWWIEVDAD